jgi:iron-sulfur cluster repair protein YtfE (RIC family)
LTERSVVEDGITEACNSVTELLCRDHRRLDSILADAKRCLVAGDLPRASARFAEFRDGLEHHIAAEEEILFPAFETFTSGAGGGPTHAMRMEHVEIRRLMAEVASNLERGDGERHTTPLAALTARIYAHNGKEERILYPAIEQAAREADALEALLRRTLLAL